MNLAIITDISNKEPIGVICSDYKTGDIAYFSLNNELLYCLDIITNNPLFFLHSEVIGEDVMIKKDEVTLFDSDYLLAVNFSLPYPWEITEVDQINGDIEEIVKAEASKLTIRGENK